MPKKLNKEYLLSTLIDYSMNYLFWGLVVYFYSNENFTKVGQIIIISSFTLMAIFHEVLYSFMFHYMISKKKLEYKYTKTDINDIMSTVIQATIINIILQHYGIVHLRYEGFFKTYFDIAVEYWLMALLKDIVSLNYFHEWMHRPENYHIHKHHHQVREEVQANHAFHIDSLDLFLENHIGLFLALFVKWLIWGKIDISYISFLCLSWQDIMIHSLNPYTVIHFNPILDFFHKPIIEHNLHHILNKGYYMFNSFRHIYQPDSLSSDLAKYNETLKTRANFSLLIDEKDNTAY